MAISLIGTASGAAANGNDAVITLPAGIAQNDIVCVYGGHPRTAVDAGPSTSGYTAENELNVTSPNRHVVFAYKVMGAVPDTSVTCRGSGDSDHACAYVVMVFRGVDTTTPIDAASTQAYGTSGTPNPPTILTVTNGAAVLAWGFSRVDDSTVFAPSGYSSGVSANRTDSTPATASGAYKIIATAGSENPLGFTGYTAGDWAALTTALRPSTSTVNSDSVFSAGSVRGTASFVGGIVTATISRDVAFTGTVATSFVGTAVGNIPAFFESGMTSAVSFEVIGGFDGYLRLTHSFNVAWVGNKELMSAVRDVIEERGFTSVTVD